MHRHSTCFSLGVLASVIVASAILQITTCIALIGAFAAAVSCNTDDVRARVNSAAAESTNGSADNSALFANFLLTLFLPVAEAVCNTGPKFNTFATLTFLGSVVSSLSFIATCCVCMGCSEDHEDADDPNSENAQQVQALMNPQ